MSYSFRKINLETDREVMSGLIRQYLKSGDESTNRTIEWNYINNPVRNASGIALLHNNQGSEIAGLINQTYRLFLVNRKRTYVGLFGDLVVDEKHRSLMPAIMLIKEALVDSLSQVPFVYSFPNKKAVNVALRAGFEKLGLVTRYVYVVSHTDYIKRMIQLSFIAKTAGIISDYFSRVRNLCRRCKYTNKYYAVDDMLSQTELHDLVSNSKLSNLIISYRSLSFIKWRYYENPFHEYDTIISRFKNTGKISGYAITEQADSLLHIRDIYAHDSESLSAMLCFVIEKARELSIHGVSIGFLGNSNIVRTILEAGFEKRESERAVVIKISDNNNSSDLLNSDLWFLVDGDEDQ